MTSIVQSELGGKSAGAFWSATITDGKRTDIFAYYRGRPPETFTSDLLKAILAGKAKRIGGFSAEGKSINIIAPSQ
jgi:hypothetical protein